MFRSVYKLQVGWRFIEVLRNVSDILGKMSEGAYIGVQEVE